MLAVGIEEAAEFFHGGQGDEGVVCRNDSGLWDTSPLRQGRWATGKSPARGKCDVTSPLPVWIWRLAAGVGTPDFRAFPPILLINAPVAYGFTLPFFFRKPSDKSAFLQRMTPLKTALLIPQ